MSKKGGDHTSTPPVQRQESDDSATMMMMYEMMMNQQAMQSAANRPLPPPVLQMPEIQRAPDIDWTEQNKILAAKAKADYTKTQSKKKGIPDTIHTSPLLDEETTTNVASVLK